MKVYQYTYVDTTPEITPVEWYSGPVAGEGEMLVHDDAGKLFVIPIPPNPCTPEVEKKLGKITTRGLHRNRGCCQYTAGLEGCRMVSTIQYEEEKDPWFCTDLSFLQQPRQEDYEECTMYRMSRRAARTAQLLQWEAD